MYDVIKNNLIRKKKEIVYKNSLNFVHMKDENLNTKFDVLHAIL